MFRAYGVHVAHIGTEVLMDALTVLGWLVSLALVGVVCDPKGTLEALELVWKRLRRR